MSWFILLSGVATVTVVGMGLLFIWHRGFAAGFQDARDIYVKNPDPEGLMGRVPKDTRKEVQYIVHACSFCGDNIEIAERHYQRRVLALGYDKPTAYHLRCWPTFPADPPEDPGAR